MPAGDMERRAVVWFGAGGSAWHDISDPIMGGVSRGEMVIAGQVGVFTGVVSLEHGGGFASVRSLEGRYDLSGFDGLVVRARGDGKRYGLRLRTATAYDGVNYQVALAPDHIWQDLWFAFRDFRPVFRGRPALGHPPLDAAEIRTFGLIIAQRQAGPFRLELESIGAYRESSG
jgi:NADH dehydrogenase [ubiquinone] 1 alpha subcomplex assembly factor 1